MVRRGEDTVEMDVPADQQPSGKAPSCLIIIPVDIYIEQPRYPLLIDDDTVESAVLRGWYVNVVLTPCRHQDRCLQGG